MPPALLEAFLINSLDEYVHGLLYNKKIVIVVTRNRTFQSDKLLLDRKFWGIRGDSYTLYTRLPQVSLGTQNMDLCGLSFVLNNWGSYLLSLQKWIPIIYIIMHISSTDFLPFL